MSFKQAKELVERMEFSEIALRRASKNLEKSSTLFDKTTKNFEKTLIHQEEIVTKIPKSDKKISYLYLALAINIGFILGLLVGRLVF
ncbi:MAG: hypothetical protein ACQERD_05955 [Campylobacterota bacterium]